MVSVRDQRAPGCIAMPWPAVAGACAAAVLAGIVLQVAGGDVWLADQIYRWEGRQWSLRDAWWTSHVLHDGGRRLTVLAWCALCATWGIDMRRRGLSPAWRAALGYLLVAIALCALLVAVCKRASGIDCPWDLVRYGGAREWTPAFRGDGACFPAGHAGSGYAWIALYFALAHAAPRWRRWGLAAGLVLGAVFGVAQQLRGAHFLSHDLSALVVCACVTAGLAAHWRWPAAVSGLPAY